jgi:cytochrome P450
MRAGEAVELLMTPVGREDPYPTYDELRAHGPLVRVQDGFFVATGYAVIDELLRDSRMFVEDDEYLTQVAPDWSPGPASRLLRRSMLQRNPPDHTRMRRLASGAFTARRVAGMRDTITAQATSLAGYLAQLGRSGAEVDFMTEFAYPLPVRVICMLLGVAAEDRSWFRDKAAALTAILEPALLAGELEEANDASRELADYFTDLVARRRREPADDLTTALVLAHDADGSTLDGDELLGNLILLLVAGFETTTNLLGNGLTVLLRHPDAAARLREDVDLAPHYVEELLRFDSPVQLTSRWSRQSTSLAGERIDPFSGILVLLGAGNRDPDRFAHPNVFDPNRDAGQPLSFGAGAHYCLGAALARLEAQVAFPLLLSRFPRLALAGEPVRRDRLTLRGYASLPVTVG